MVEASVAADFLELDLDQRTCRFAAAIAEQELLFADSESEPAALSSTAEKAAQGHPFAFDHQVRHIPWH